MLRELVCVLIVVVLGMVDSCCLKSKSIGNEIDLKTMFRRDWRARVPTDTEKLNTPVPYVVIHHTYIPEACFTREECIKAMKVMQDFHMDYRGWFDIGYNFCVGSDGSVYEGRGWTTLGAHSLHFNTVSLGICLIGNWNMTLPPENQMKTTLKLIELGQSKGYIQENYKLIGHRQVRDTPCPGEALFREIQTWEHYSEYPNQQLIN